MPRRQIRDAIDQGINYIDTAVPYHGGESERFLGRALQDGYREKVKLATKLPPQSVNTREDMDRILDIQLKKLKTDHIDYYLLHGLNDGQWKKLRDLGVLEFLDKAKADGRIRNAGFSFHGDRKTFKEIIDAYDWVFCQIQYNFLDETNQAGTEGLALCGLKEYRRHGHGAAAGRHARRQTPERSRADLQPCRNKTLRRGMGAPLGLEPP